MAFVTKFLLFSFLFILFYAYLGYPLLVFIIGMIRSNKVNKDGFEPRVTILISAYNEEEAIEQTLQNKLELEYPRDKLEILVVSDGSTDRTDEIIGKYKNEQVRLIRQEPRAGKTSALNMAVPQAKGEILAFSDANSTWAKHALAKIARNFADSTVGYVTGKMIYVNPDGTSLGDGCTAYMKYENFLRSGETSLGSVVGVDGGIDAVRKTLYKPMNVDQLPDFVLPLKVVEQGYRVVYEPEAIVKESSLKEQSDEYRMRVRVALRSFWALWDMRHLLMFRLGHRLSHVPTFSYSFLFTWQLWSHKLLRYLCFFFLIGVYFSNLSLWSQGFFYKAFFILQNAGYLGAILSPVLDKNGHRIRLLYLLSYFFLLNLASAHAFIKFLLGQKTVIWEPRKG